MRQIHRHTSERGGRIDLQYHGAALSIRVVAREHQGRTFALFKHSIRGPELDAAADRTATRSFEEPEVGEVVQAGVGRLQYRAVSAALRINEYFRVRAAATYGEHIAPAFVDPRWLCTRVTLKDHDWRRGWSRIRPTINVEHLRRVDCDAARRIRAFVANVN